MPRTIGFVLLVVILLAAGAFAWWEFAIHRALPQVEGAISLPELKAEVQVTRDVRGYPTSARKTRTTFISRKAT